MLRVQCYRPSPDASERYLDERVKRLCGEKKITPDEMQAYRRLAYYPGQSDERTVVVHSDESLDMMALVTLADPERARSSIVRRMRARIRDKPVKGNPDISQLVSLGCYAKRGDAVRVDGVGPDSERLKMLDRMELLYETYYRDYRTGLVASVQEIEFFQGDPKKSFFAFHEYLQDMLNVRLIEIAACSASMCHLLEGSNFSLSAIDDARNEMPIYVWNDIRDVIGISDKGCE